MSYARLVCALLDVPVAGGDQSGRGGGDDRPVATRPLLEALHHLFVLLLEFRANPFFKQALGEGGGYHSTALHHQQQQQQPY